jgi:hypothetical protein
MQWTMASSKKRRRFGFFEKVCKLRAFEKKMLTEIFELKRAE